MQVSCKSLVFLAILSALFVIHVSANKVRAVENSLVADGAKVEKIASGMKFTEGPVWLSGKNKVVFSDIPNSKLMQWNEKDGLSEFRPSKKANGNILDLDGNIISCQHFGRNIVRISKEGKSEVVVDKFDGKRFNSPNDVAIRSDGTLWFTDPHWGLEGRERDISGNWVYKYDPKTKKVEAVIKDLAMPNGIVFSPDEKKIYVADTGGNARHPDEKYRRFPQGIHCYEVTDDGKLGKKLFSTKEGSDGMAVDVKGNVYATHGKHVNVYSADGKKIEAIEVPEGPANCCFGGKDLKTLFITARTSLYSIRLKNAGHFIKKK